MKRTKLLGSAAGVALALVSQSAFAQAVDPGEIVVTARKREETLLDVPVIASVLTSEAIESRQLVDLREVARVVPGLSLGEASGNLGTQVSLRGVGTGGVNATIDASVALNVDGLMMTQSVSYTAAMFDLQRIEVLKGPQSLFYGKNSPGGVIALRTADPSNTVEVTGRVGYEFEAKEVRSELVLSGPVSDTLKLRLAGLYDQQDGFFKNRVMVTPGFGSLNPTDRDWAPNKNYIVRGTVLWDPTPDFSARLKVNLTRDNTTGGDTNQLASCPDGTGAVPPLNIPFIGPGEECRLNRTVRAPLLDPANFPGVPNGGVPFKKLKQKFGTLELNFRLTPQLSLNSTTGYYDLAFNNISAVATNIPVFIGIAFLGREEFTQELRLESDFDGPLNFMAGAFFEDGRIDNLVDLPTNRAFAAFRLPTTLGNYQQLIDIEAYSVFGQARWFPIPQLEVAAGARWTKEKRKLTAYTIAAGARTLFPTATPAIKSDNVAPELTVTYKPTDDLTLFGSYKVAYKSGSFDTTVLRGVLPDYAFGDEKAEGGELGIKARLLDRSLLLNFAVYDYRYKGLQVGTSAPFPGGSPINRTLNAGSSRVYGAEFDATFAPRGIEGLTLRGAVAYTHARFKDLHGVPCWEGQTIAAGCTEVLSPITNLFTGQDLSGFPLVRAPEWQASFGFTYERPVGNLTLRLSNTNQYSSRYLAFLGIRDDFYQDGFFKTDASVELLGPEKRWELAFIGKNLTNKITSANCGASNQANGGLFGGAITGGTGRGLAGVAELSCFPERGRELWLRVTVRPFGR